MELTSHDKQQIRTWVAALESGIYPQGKLTLYDNGEYCCLAVLAVTALKHPDELLQGYDMLSEIDIRPDWMNSSFEKRCMSWNDTAGKSFEEIAQLVRQRFPSAFESTQ